MPGIEIRLAIASEAPEIASVLYESFIEYRPSYTVGAFDATAASAEEIQERMKQGPVWVAVHASAIVGTVAAVTKGDTLYIRGMAIRPSARGQAIGRLLLETIKKHALAQGYRRVTLSTTPFLDRAIRLYESFGFRRTGEGPHDLCGTPLFTMELNLRPEP